MSEEKKQTKDVIFGQIKEKKDLFMNLAERWAEEKQYEEVADYNEVVAAQFPSLKKTYEKNHHLLFDFDCEEGYIQVKCGTNEKGGGKLEVFFYEHKSTTNSKETNMSKSTKKTTTIKSTKKVDKSAKEIAEKTEKIVKKNDKLAEKTEKLLTPKKDEKKPTEKAKDKKPTEKAKDKKPTEPTKKAKDKKPTETAKKADKPRKIADVIKEGLLKGDKKGDILDAVKKEFPTASTNFACIAWYKSTMKKNGELA